MDGLLRPCFLPAKPGKDGVPVKRVLARVCAGQRLGPLPMMLFMTQFMTLS
jgi:hypothetical protein